jgi:hypothetical protein
VGPLAPLLLECLLQLVLVLKQGILLVLCLHLLLLLL